MTNPKVAGKKLGSIEAVKASLKRGGSSNVNYIKHVGDFEKLTDSDLYLKTDGRMSGTIPIELPGNVIQNILITELNLSNGEY